MYRTRLLTTILTYLFLNVTAFAQKITRYGSIIDQDLLGESFGLKNSNQDRNYTMGVGVFLTNSNWANRRLFQWLGCVSETTRDRMGKKLFGDDFEKRATVTVSFGMTAFTPRYLGDNIADSLYYIEEDRPFASLLFLSTKYQVATRRKAQTNQLVVGVMGLKIAQEAQTHIHKNHWMGSTREIPDGWKYQIGQGGKFTAMYSDRADILLNYKSSFLRCRKHNINTQFIATREYRIGYYTDVSAGIAMRIGFLDPDNWTSYDTYQLSYASSRKASTRFEHKRRLEAELFFLFSLRPHLYAYNQFLQSKDTELDYNFRVNPFVVDGLAGVGATIPNAKKNFSTNIMLYLAGRSPELRSKLCSRTHTWGGVQLSFTRIKP